MTDTSRKDTRFKPGHPHYPPYSKHPRQPDKWLSLRQQREAQVETLAIMISDMAERYKACPTSVDPVAFATLINTFQRAQKENA